LEILGIFDKIWYFWHFGYFWHFSAISGYFWEELPDYCAILSVCGGCRSCEVEAGQFPILCTKIKDWKDASN
jgi:hypothetical protein